VSDNSPLRRLPAALHRRQALALDGISVSVDMTMVAYWQLRVALWHHGRASERATSWPLVLQAVTAAWSIVDDVHRIGVLVRRLPGLKRGPAVTALLKAADQVESPRNAVQHLDGEIEELPDSGRPLWGSLFWVKMASPDAKRLSVGLLVPGTLAPTHGVPVVNPLGREIELPIDLATLTAGRVTVCLSHVVAAAARFSGRLEGAAEAAFAAIPAGASDFTARLNLPIGP
jgi:hypothetical protein